jgi:hypothetical protein
MFWHESELGTLINFVLMPSKQTQCNLHLKVPFRLSCLHRHFHFRMGVNHGGTGGTNPPPQNLQWGTLIQVVPPDFCHFSKFQALAMDSSPPPDFNPDLRHCTFVILSNFL